MLQRERLTFSKMVSLFRGFENGKNEERWRALPVEREPFLFFYYKNFFAPLSTSHCKADCEGNCTSSEIFLFFIYGTHSISHIKEKMII